MTELKATDLFLKTPLGAVAENLGINPTLATQLVGSDPSEAVDIFSSRFGLNPLVIHGIISVIKRDLPKTLNTIGELAQVHGVDLNPKLAQMFIGLA